MSPSLAHNNTTGRGWDGACCVMNSPCCSEAFDLLRKRDVSTRMSSRAARHLHALDRLVRQFRFGSVPVWPKTSEQYERKHHRPTQTCEWDSVGMKAVVSRAHQEYSCRS